jgi:hypothetical protein
VSMAGRHLGRRWRRCRAEHPLEGERRTLPRFRRARRRRQTLREPSGHRVVKIWSRSNPLPENTHCKENLDESEYN